MQITVLGAGNVATSLVPALHHAGHEVQAVYARREAEARRLASPHGALALTNTLQLPQSECFIFCVKDDALPSLLRQVVPMHREAFFVHTAGSVPMDVFSEYAKHYGVIYPLQTFSRQRPIGFADVPLFVEGNTPQSSARLLTLAQSLSHRVVPLDSEGRARMHLAAVFACNFANHCFTLAAEQMAAAGVDFQELMPLIGETFTKIRHMPPAEAQTGPAARGDTSVMQRHEALLAGSDALEVYRVMSESIGKHHH